jgi:hypothetical protein
MAHGHDFGIDTPCTSSISDRGYTQILQMNTSFSVQNMDEFFLQRLDPSYRSEVVSTQAVGWNGGEPPSRLIFAILFAWVGADTYHYDKDTTDIIRDRFRFPTDEQQRQV